MYDDQGDRGRYIFAGTGAPADAEDLTLLAKLATDLGTRRVGTAQERADLDPRWLFEGLTWFDTSDQTEYQYISGRWVAMFSRWVNFSPQYTGMSGGTTIYSKVRRVYDNAEVRFSWQLGNFPSIGNIALTPPIPIASWVDDTDYLGQVELIDVGSSADARYIGPVIRSNNNALSRVLTTSGTASGSAVQTSGTTSSFPFQWTPGDRIRFTLSYPIDI